MGFLDTGAERDLKMLTSLFFSDVRVVKTVRLTPAGVPAGVKGVVQLSRAN